jgi:hypothetical protein
LNVRLLLAFLIVVANFTFITSTLAQDDPLPHGMAVINRRQIRLNPLNMTLGRRLVSLPSISTGKGADRFRGRRASLLKDRDTEGKIVDVRPMEHGGRLMARRPIAGAEVPVRILSLGPNKAAT